jgi:hypothetical protein
MMGYRGCSVSYNISAATFIRNCYQGAFCLFESMASFLPFVDDMTVIDLGSTDGTLQTLQEIAAANPKVRVVQSRFSRIDAGAFADIANDCVAAWEHDSGIFWQADEIWHQDLLRLMHAKLEEGQRDMIFWRYQLRENFQVMKWPPHPVHRVGTKGRFHFVQDGMNSDRSFEPPICSTYGMEHFIRWGDDYRGRYPKLPTKEMVLDVSAIGGFIQNIIGKRKLHAPMWHEQPNVEGEPVGQWFTREKNNPNWTKPQTPFDIPQIMRWHVGRTQYELRPELLEALKTNTTEGILGL